MKLHSGFRRLGALVLSVILACGALAGCSDVSEIVSGVAAAGEFPVEVNEVTISARPQKVAVLSASLADVVLALGSETQLALGSEDCTQESLQDLAKVPGDDAQAVIDAAPDLVLADPGANGIGDALRDAGLDYAVKVIDRSSPSVLNPGTRADFGTMGMSPGAQYEYIIYVNKRDYDAARDAAGLPGDIR